MAEANGADASASTPLENIFGSESKSAAPAASDKKKEDEDKSSVPATDKDNTDKLPADDSEKKKKSSEKEKPKVEKPKLPGESKKDEESDEDKDGAAEEKPKKKTPQEEEAERKANAELLDKRLKDTQTWGNKLSQENADLKRSHAELEKKLDIITKQIADPDYDPEQDPKYRGPSPEDIASEAVLAGKITASRQMAYDTYGKDAVDQVLASFREVTKGNKAIEVHVRDSDSPVMAAIQVMEDLAFRKQYGERPHQIYEAIKKEVEVDLRKTIRAEIVAQIKEGKELKDSTVEGLSNMKKTEKGKADTKKGHVETPLSDIFTA